MSRRRKKIAATLAALAVAGATAYYGPVGGAVAQRVLDVIAPMVGQ